ncbi:MAG: hypothetical protein GQE15_24890 [Archangiaceae bacterium]|nr:hypothetical protein [Archangiaceae bacterium]
MDYRRFLAKTETLTLPWLGGRDVDAGDRRLRLNGPPPAKPGWYAFEISGRKATVKGPADAPDLSKVPKVRGWLRGDRLFRDGGVVEVVQLMPEEEPAAFSPVVARRWSPNVLLFESLEFESEAEGAVREALGERKPLREVKGVPAPVRAAYGLALLERVARDKNVRFAPQEIWRSLGAVGEEGVPKAEEVLRALEEERELARRELAELERRRQEELVRQELELQRQLLRAQREEDAAQAQAQIDAVRMQMARGGPRQGNAREAAAWRRNVEGRAEERAETALEAAGATLETLRRLGRDQLEIVFQYQGERFISIVDAATLQVIDSGICLGHPPRDDLVTLESLIGVIQEAMDTGALVILRWP